MDKITGELKKPGSRNYDFIDTIRFISMMAIVMEHCSYFWGVRFASPNQELLQILTIQFPKFGTVMFFLLSGFLIGDKFTTYNTGEYLKRRFGNTIKPWLFWILVLIALNYLDLYIQYVKFGNDEILINPIARLFKEFTDIIFYSAYWFIINFLVCITFLLLFRKYIYKMWFGAILLAFSVFYSVNLYVDLIPTAHTTAFFGFIFYLWLGVQLNKYFTPFTAWVEKVAVWKLIAATALTFVLSCYETYALMDIRPDDPFNTLKITNIIYSLISFMLLFKLLRHVTVTTLNPRKFTFGIYLVHQILVFRLLPTIYKPLELYPAGKSAGYYLFIQLIGFCIVYPASLLIVYLINKVPKMRWMIGQ